jgi:hypothetical protein
VVSEKISQTEAVYGEMIHSTFREVRICCGGDEKNVVINAEKSLNNLLLI